MTNSCAKVCVRLGALALSLVLVLFASASYAQSTGATISGTVLDAQGNAIPNAEIVIKNEATGAVSNTTTNSTGSYSVSGLAAGKYTVLATAIGFANRTRSGIALAAGQSAQIELSLSVNGVTQQVTVNAGVDSVAVQTAPSGGFLEERSAQSLVSNNYIENFTSPVADFGELVQIVPGAFTTSTNGVGLGQSKTYFRGFPDGDYNIDFDGIPFYDTNTPSHHSWAFFPSQWIGGVDFDRSPGSASTIGPTPFGGSIHFLSKPFMSEENARFTGSYGTWNTKLYEGSFNSGPFGFFGGAQKSNLFIDVHHMTSDGYQSFNYNLRNAGAIEYQYTFSPKTMLTGFAGVVQLNSNGPNISSSRCMLYGASASGAYGCSYSLFVNGSTTATNFNQPYTGAGYKFLLSNNNDPASWFDYQYNRYQIPTDFEYVSLKKELPRGWYFEFKPYTYNYDNGELYSNATPITDATTINSSTVPGAISASSTAGGKASYYYDGVAVAPCNVLVTKKGVSALPCGIDKYNSYRKYGETLLVTQTSRLGMLRAGMWYDRARTDRHQYPSDPLNNWADQPLGKFNEQFWTNSYQPYAEYEFHVTPKLYITAGVKYAGYTIDVLHHADDGATVGALTCASATAACSATISNHGTFTAWLPSIDANYHLMPNWSVYGQLATGSIVPPSAVYDYNQTAASASAAIPTLATPPKQQKSTTYQFGTVFKANRLTLDGDFYHVRFQNSYSSTVDNIPGDVNLGDTIFYLQPSSITKGFEVESNIVLTHDLNLYLNTTYGNAYYSGSLNASTSQSSPIFEKAPGGLWVAQTPSDTEMEGLTYQSKGFDVGFFNKRVGEERIDNGQYHNQGIIDPFSSLGGYFNYTIHNHNLFDQTKIRLSGTNLLDSHNVQSLSLAGTANTIYLNGGGTCSSPTAANPCDAFVTNGATAINGQDTPSLMAGRSFSVTVTFGLSPKERERK